MAGVTSLNGKFTYPVELLNTFTANKHSVFKKSVSIGDNSTNDKVANLSVGENNQSDDSGAVSFGTNSKALAENSFSAGNNVSVEGESKNSISIGTHATAENKNSFVWSGDDGRNTNYKSKGSGTFCICPEKGDSGFYICDKNLPEIIKNYAIKYVQEEELVFSGKTTFAENAEFDKGVFISGGELKTDVGVVSEFNGTVKVPEVNENDSSLSAASTKFVSEKLKKCVLLSGGTMTGDLILNRQPEEELQAATKNYVDDTVSKSISDGVRVDNSMITNGFEVARVIVNGTPTSIYAPKIVAGNSAYVSEDKKSGTVTVGFNSSYSFSGGSIIVPVGTIIPFAGNNNPDGFIPCNGEYVSIEKYPELYAVIGSNFGQVIGNSFRLPDLSDNTIISGKLYNGVMDSTHLKLASEGESGIYMNTLSMKYYIKAKTVQSDKPVKSVNGKSPDESGNVDVSFKHKVETWTFKTMSGKEYTRKVVIEE